MNWSAIATFLADAEERPVFVFDATGIVRLCNRALERLLGRPRRDVVGEAWHRIVDPGAREKVGRAARQARGNGPKRCLASLRSAAGAAVESDLTLHSIGDATVAVVCPGCSAGDDDFARLAREKLATLAHRHQLSDREREVLDQLVRGRSVEEIGEALGISPRTAKFHQANVLTKLGIASRVELLRLLLQR